MAKKLSEEVNKKLKARKESRYKKEQEDARLLKTMKEQLELFKKTIKEEGLFDLISKYPDIEFKETEKLVSLTCENIRYSVFLVEHKLMFETTITLEDARRSASLSRMLDDGRILDDLADHLARMIELINNKQ